MTNYYPLFIIAYLLIKAFAEEGASKKVATPQGLCKTPSLPKKHIQYISNGKLLDDTLFCYYNDMLGLSQENKVNEDTIVLHAKNRYELINKIDYDPQWPVATRDVNAAKTYALERYYYMTHLN